MTAHSLIEDDCRNLGFITDESVDLIITHPAYMGELNPVIAECERVLAPGGCFICIASPAPRRDEELPLAADVYVLAQRHGLTLERTIRWLPSGQAALDASAFYGAPNQPCGEILCDSREILVMRTPGERVVSLETQVASRLGADLFAACSSTVWLIPGSPDPRHPQSLPFELAERLIRMFSFVSDAVLDPFARIGTTSAAARACGRNSVGVEIEGRYFESMAARLSRAEVPDAEIEISGRRFARPSVEHRLPTV